MNKLQDFDGEKYDSNLQTSFIVEANISRNNVSILKGTCF